MALMFQSTVCVCFSVLNFMYEMYPNVMLKRFEIHVYLIFELIFVIRRLNLKKNTMGVSGRHFISVDLISST
jgi:hypothetical protein